MRMKYIALAVSVLLLAACQSTGTDSGSADAGGRGGYSGMSSNLSQAERARVIADLEQNVGDRVFFGYDRYDLSAEARETLDRQVSWMRKNQGVFVTVEGHADERGTREYNLALGERRANAVKNYLVSMGVNEARVYTVSYGKERPAVTGSGDASWAQNRRGVTVVN
ncbi:MAG: peptidoglycan-associated lipoprotein Pal [Pseudomonadota bacterium]|nr:peptidoglycan-associated lipoprotein Pal [Pseudomonadota bacterium]